MKLKSLLFLIVALLLVAVISFLIGGSMRGRNPDQESIPTPIVETEHSSSPLKIANGATNQEKIKVSNTSTTNENQIGAIEAEFGRKKKEIEEYYADRFRQLQQNVESTLKGYDAADRASYAQFTEQLKSTVSTSSGSVSMSGYVSPSGSVSADGSYYGTTETEVVGNPSLDYSHHIQKTNKAINNLMDDYELDFEHLLRRRACALDDLEKEKALALATVHSQNASQSVPLTFTIAQGTVTGIIYSEENPLTVIDGKVLHEGQNINSVKVIKINQDSVEFESAGTHWSQRVNEPPSNNWP